MSNAQLAAVSLVRAGPEVADFVSQVCQARRALKITPQVVLKVCRYVGMTKFNVTITQLDAPDRDTLYRITVTDPTGEGFGYSKSAVTSYLDQAKRIADRLVDDLRASRGIRAHFGMTVE